MSLSFAFLVLDEHPYGREMLRQLLDADFAPEIIIEESSKVADVEREKFFVRIAGQPSPPTFTELLEGREVRREKVEHHNDADCRRLLEESRPDLLVLGGTRILQPHIFEVAPLGTLNSHPGLLPEVRGSASVAWAIHLDERVGCTCHFIEAGIDTGPIVGRREIPVTRADTYESLCWKTIELSATLMVEALEGLRDDTLERRPQGAGPKAYRNMPDEQVENVKRKLADGGYAHYVD